MVVLGKVKRINEKFCNFFFVCLSADHNRISSGCIEAPPIILLIEIFLRG